MTHTETAPDNIIADASTTKQEKTKEEPSKITRKLPEIITIPFPVPGPDCSSHGKKRVNPEYPEVVTIPVPVPPPGGDSMGGNGVAVENWF